MRIKRICEEEEVILIKRIAGGRRNDKLVFVPNTLKIAILSLKLVSQIWRIMRIMEELKVRPGYRNGKCNIKSVGINIFTDIPKIITFLGL